MARGAAVETDRIIYFISISFGKLPVEGAKPVYALSPVSPAAQAMLGKRAGEVFEINGARHTIREGGPLPNACAGASKVRVECGGLCGWCYFKSLRVTTIIH